MHAGQLSLLLKSEQNENNKNNRLAAGDKLLSTNHAKLVATCWGLGGIGLLHVGTDPITTVLGASNIALYSGLYTWMKPRSVYNTWVGAVVGAIPPVMGYTAAATAAASAAATTSAPTSVMALFFLTDPEVYYLAATLYYWQMPHFFALSFMHRADYQRGGFRMLPVVEMEEQSQQHQPPTFDKTANVILRNTLYLSAMPLLASYCNLIHGSDTMFLLETSVLNGYVLWKSQEFYNDRTNAKARKMFLTSLWYLPSIFVIYLLHSKLWVFDEDENKISDDRITGMLRELRTVGTQYCLHEKASETASHTTITNTKTNTTTKVGDTACPITMAKSKIEGSSSMIQDFVTKQQQEIQKIVLNGVISNSMDDDNDNNKRK